MTALSVLEDLAARCRAHDCSIVISGPQRQRRLLLHKAGFLRGHRVVLAVDLAAALDKSRAIVERHESALAAGPNARRLVP